MKQRPSFPARLANPPALAGKAVRVSAAPSASRGAPGLAESGFAARRRNMVARLRQQGLADTQVAMALEQVERHSFVDSALRGQAYDDTSLPIGLGQTISKPGVVARMIELLRSGRAGKLGRVLEIGTGCGYQAAVLSLQIGRAHV